MITSGLSTIKLVEAIHENAIKIMFHEMLFTLDGDTTDGVAFKRLMSGQYVRSKFNVDIYEEAKLSWEPVEIKDMAVEIGKRLFKKDDLWLRYQIHELNSLLDQMGRLKIRETQLELTKSVASMDEQEVMAFLEQCRLEHEKKGQQQPEAPEEKTDEEALKEVLDKCNPDDQHPEADAGPQGEELI